MACGACAKRQGKSDYKHVDKNGKITIFGTETEAKAAVARRGGTYSEKK